MQNSSIQGKTWYWRRGIKHMPVGSDLIIKTIELCLVVPDFIEGNRVLRELKANAISADTKYTHSHSDYIPDNSLIVYTDIIQNNKVKKNEENIERLKNYILAHDGKIGNNQPKVVSHGDLFKNFFDHLFHHKGK